MTEGGASSSGSLVWSRYSAKDNADTSSLDDEVDIDDEFLIRAYEKSRKLALGKLKTAESPDTRQKPLKSALKNSSRSKRTEEVSSGSSQQTCPWKIGDRCMVLYQEDGMPYEAEILRISLSTQTCVIKYCDYDDEEEKTLKELLPVPVKYENVAYQSSSTEGQPINDSANGGPSGRFCGSCGCPPGPTSALPNSRAFILPPPLSPSAMPLLQSPSGPSSSTLHCALMSWYMAGFHTGYHQAVTDLRTSTEGKNAENVTSRCTTGNTGCCRNNTPPSPHCSNSQMNRSSTKKPSPV